MNSEEVFDLYYQDLFEKRWETLKQSLISNVKHVGLRNVFCDSEIVEQLNAASFEHDEFCLEIDSSKTFVKDSKNLSSHYCLDPASLFPVLDLYLEPGQKILDLCAAPGGKSLRILMGLKGQADLTLNDSSMNRFYRLKKVIYDYIPEEIIQKNIRLTHHDGRKWGLYEKNTHDRILVDAPCGSERHLLQNPSEMKKWSPKRSKQLSMRQYALLVSAFHALKNEGIMVYSTCSLNDLENDCVIRKFLKKYGQQSIILNSEYTLGEQKEFGVHILPDKTGYGPIYYSIIKKIKNS